MFGQALQATQGLGWLSTLGASARSALPGTGTRRTQRHDAQAGCSESATILFADICGSTPLYQAAGDREALALVAACIDRLAVVAREYGGRIVRSKGDDLLCTFADPDAALAAARRMVASQPGTAVRVRAALHHGHLIRARGDIFGDAVNLAARVLGVGKADEVLVTGELHEQLASIERSVLRRLGEHTLKGMQAPVSLYIAPPSGGTDSITLHNLGPETMRLVTGRARAARSTLTLACGRVQRRCEDGESALIGRASHCDLVMPLSWVSREHATITFSDGKLTLADHSSTGTHVRLADGHELCVRRETIVLSGSGSIIPGRKHAEVESNALRFSIDCEA